jgi:hypothetical protein
LNDLGLVSIGVLTNHFNGSLRGAGPPPSSHDQNSNGNAHGTAKRPCATPHVGSITEFAW